MKVKLKKNKNINKSIYLRNSIVDLPDEEAKKLIAAQEAEPVNESVKPEPKKDPSKESAS